MLTNEWGCRYITHAGSMLSTVYSMLGISTAGTIHLYTLCRDDWIEMIDPYILYRDDWIEMIDPYFV